MLIPSGMPGVEQHAPLEPIDESDLRDQGASHANQSPEANAASEYDIPPEIEENVRGDCVKKCRPQKLSQSTTQMARDAKDKGALTGFVSDLPRSLRTSLNTHT